MGPRPHLWFFAFKTAPLAAELQVSMGPSSHLWFYTFTTATLWPELIVSMGRRPHLSLWARKTTWLTSELLVSMGPSLHLWILHAKQWLLDQNYKSLWVPALICGFWMQNNDFWTRITSLYGSQPSSVAFACKTATLGPELQVSMGPRSHLCFLHSKRRLWHKNCMSLLVPTLIWGFCMQNSDFWARISSLYGSQPSSVGFACKTATFGPELQVSMGSRPHLWFLHAKQRF